MHARRKGLFAEQDVPDARQRLVHVLELTDDAAHQTMELIERAMPLFVATLSNRMRIVGEVAEPSADTAPVLLNGYRPVVPGAEHAAVRNQQDMDAPLSDLGL